MKKIIALFILFTSVVATLSAKESADTTAVFTVQPQMTCQNCENKIKSNLRFEKGVKEIVTSLSDQTVSVTYNPKKTNVENICKGFSKIGYTASVDKGTKQCDKKATGNCCKKNASECCKKEANSCKKEATACKKEAATPSCCSQNKKCTPEKK